MEVDQEGAARSRQALLRPLQRASWEAERQPEVHPWVVGEGAVHLPLQAAVWAWHPSLPPLLPLSVLPLQAQRQQAAPGLALHLQVLAPLRPALQVLRLLGLPQPGLPQPGLPQPGLPLQALRLQVLLPQERHLAVPRARFPSGRPFPWLLLVLLQARRPSALPHLWPLSQKSLGQPGFRPLLVLLCSPQRVLVSRRRVEPLRLTLGQRPPNW